MPRDKNLPLLCPAHEDWYWCEMGSGAVCRVRWEGSCSAALPDQGRVQAGLAPVRQQDRHTWG